MKETLKSTSYGSAATDEGTSFEDDAEDNPNQSTEIVPEPERPSEKLPEPEMNIKENMPAPELKKPSGE